MKPLLSKENIRSQYYEQSYTRANINLLMKCYTSTNILLSFNDTSIFRFAKYDDITSGYIGIYLEFIEKIELHCFFTTKISLM